MPWPNARCGRSAREMSSRSGSVKHAGSWLPAPNANSTGSCAGISRHGIAELGVVAQPRIGESVADIVVSRDQPDRESLDDDPGDRRLLAQPRIERMWILGVRRLPRRQIDLLGHIPARSSPPCLVLHLDPRLSN